MSEFRIIPQSVKEWWSLRSEMQRDVWNVGFFTVGAGVLAGLGWFFGRPVYEEWRQGTAMEQVEQFAEQDDYRNALLALRRATEANPSEPAVWQRAAEFLARIGSPEVVVAQRNLARLNPDDMGLKVALVTEALRFSDLESALEGLDQLEEAARHDAAFHRLAGAVALAMGEQQELRRHLQALIQAAPEDYRARFNLAAIDLWSANEDVSAAAGVELGRLCTQPEVRVRAALERLKFAAASRNAALVDAEVAFVVKTFDPSQSGMALLRSDPHEPPGWDQLLELLKDAATAHDTDAALLARWMADIGLEREALAWVQSLPVELKESDQLTVALADLAAKTNDLEQLREVMASGRMGQIPAATINLALAARVQSLEFGGGRSRPTWEDAIATSANSLAGLRMLARLGGMWQDQVEVNLALEKIVELYPREFWACEALRINYAVAGDLEMLWRLYQIWAPRVPDNVEVQSTWIMLAAILNRVGENHLAKADELWAKQDETTDPAVVLAMVAALWRTGSFETAERYLDYLPVGAERQPRTLLWRGIIAAELNDEPTLRYTSRNLSRDALMLQEVVLLDTALDRREQRLATATQRERTRASGPVSGVPGGTARIPGSDG